MTVSSQKVFKMPKNWRNFAAIKRKRISLSRNEGSISNRTPMLGHKGHFFVCTDHKRSLIPLVYLPKKIFKELLRLSAEEFGLRIGGLNTLPCDASFMDYIAKLIEQDRCCRTSGKSIALVNCYKLLQFSVCFPGRTKKPANTCLQLLNKLHFVVNNQTCH